MSLRSYGGGELSIISQVKICLSRGNLTVEIFLQVQKGAPVDLLLGTDVLSHLGFSFSRLENNGKLTYLLEKPESGLNMEVVKEATKGSAEPELASVPEEITPSVVVKLIRATRLPIHHFKLVYVNVDCPRGHNVRWISRCYQVYYFNHEKPRSGTSCTGRRRYHWVRSISQIDGGTAVSHKSRVAAVQDAWKRRLRPRSPRTAAS